MKKVFFVILVTALVPSFLSVSTHAAEEYRWKIGHVRSEGTAIDKDTRWLVERISNDSGGRITFTIYPESKLGDYSVVQERCAFGEVEMYIAPFGAAIDRKLVLPFTPYLVKDWAEAKRVFAPDSVLMSRMQVYLEKQNIKLLGGWPVYFGGIVLTDEPPSPGDPDIAKEMIIRVPPIRSFELTARALGYKPYPATWVYARSGLESGMFEGMIGGGAEGYAGLRDLAKYYLAVNDHFEHWFIYMNLDLWKGLSDGDKALVQNAVSEMEARRFEVAEADEQANLKRLSDQGTMVITFTEQELAKMRDKVRRTVWPTLREEIGEAFADITSSVQH